MSLECGFKKPWCLGYSKPTWLAGIKKTSGQHLGCGSMRKSANQAYSTQMYTHAAPDAEIPRAASLPQRLMLHKSKKPGKVEHTAIPALGRGRRTRTPKSFLATQCVWGQVRIHETLSQCDTNQRKLTKQKNKYMNHSDWKINLHWSNTILLSVLIGKFHLAKGWKF